MLHPTWRLWFISKEVTISKPGINLGPQIMVVGRKTNHDSHIGHNTELGIMVCVPPHAIAGRAKQLSKRLAMVYNDIQARSVMG